MFRKILFLFVLLLTASFFVSAQTPNPAAQTPNLETILNEAQKQTDFYRETFRNLLAEETKTFEDFDKSGNSDKKTNIKSNFLVYQSGKNANSTSELRNVIEVNGKPVADSQKRSDELFAELNKTSTLEKELKKIESESLRFDKTWIINGLTLNEGLILNPDLRSAFDFQIVGTENLPENNYYVVSYRQNKPSSSIIINGKDSKSTNLTLQIQIDIPKQIKKEDLILQGKLWIDATNYQIRREERNIVSKSADSVVLHSTNLEYQPSEYGISVPKNIVMTFFDVKKQNNGFSAVKDTVVNFDYSKFRQTNVEIIVLDN